MPSSKNQPTDPAAQCGVRRHAPALAVLLLLPVLAACGLPREAALPVVPPPPATPARDTPDTRCHDACTPPATCPNPPGTAEVRECLDTCRWAEEYYTPSYVDRLHACMTADPCAATVDNACLERAALSCPPGPGFDSMVEALCGVMVRCGEAPDADTCRESFATLDDPMAFLRCFTPGAYDRMAACFSQADCKAYTACGQD